jgi:hypothetical protein
VPEGENPVPVQEEALVEDQVRVDDWPDVIEVGLADREAVGTGLVTVPEPLKSPG